MPNNRITITIMVRKPAGRDELIAAIDAQWNKHSLIEKKVHEKVEEVGRNVTYALPHEFRSVLNEVIGSAKYLNNASEVVESDEIKELSDDIIFSANRLMKITENFLTYVRIESFVSRASAGLITLKFLMARATERCSTGWCVGPSSPTNTES